MASLFWGRVGEILCLRISIEDFICMKFFFNFCKSFRLVMSVLDVRDEI